MKLRIYQLRCLGIGLQYDGKEQQCLEGQKKELINSTKLASAALKKHLQFKLTAGSMKHNPDSCYKNKTSQLTSPQTFLNLEVTNMTTFLQYILGFRIKVLTILSLQHTHTHTCIHAGTHAHYREKQQKFRSHMKKIQSIENRSNSKCLRVPVFTTPSDAPHTHRQHWGVSVALCDQGGVART